MEALQFWSPGMFNQPMSRAFPPGIGVSFLFFFPNRLPPRLVSFKIESTNSEFTLTYLMDSCGLAPETAASVSQKIQLRSNERPDSVLALLKEHGLSKSQISSLVRTRPSILLANPNHKLSPKLEFFCSMGFSKSDLARIISADPSLLSRSLEKQIIPSYNFLKSILISDRKVASSLKRSSWILRYDPTKKLMPNISVLRSTGVPESCIALLLAHFPETLMLKNDQIIKAVEEIGEMGFDPTKSAFVLALHVIAGNKSLYDRCCEVYRRWGWSEEEIQISFRKQPNCMLLSDEKITKTMEFLVNKIGWPSGMIARCPSVLLYSLEKRIKPRYSVVLALRLKGLIKKRLSLSTVLLPSKNIFEEKFVTKYEKQVPELWRVYEMKIDFMSVM